MKILILANNDGGLYKFRRELIEELVKDHDVYVSVPEGEFIREIRALGCKVGINRFLDRRGKNPFRDFSLLRYYDRIIKRIGPDIVFTYTIKPNIYGGFACRKNHIPYIVNITGLGTAVENGGILQKVTLFLYKEGLKSAQKVFFQNEANKTYMLERGIVKKDYEVLPGSGVNTIQHCYEEYPPDGDIIFTTIGRIMKDKGIDEILQAAKVIRKDYPQTKFRLIGGFDENYKSEVEKQERNDVIEYIEEQKNIHPFMAESHAVLHASYHEGMSNVLLEGASTGRPVIATNVPGCRETFDEGVSGIGFQEKNAEDLIRALKEFIELPYEKKAEMGRAGRRKIEKEFGRKFVIRKYIAEIDKIKKKDEICLHNYMKN